MALKPETTFINRINKMLPASIYKLKLALAFSNGVPDMWYSGPGGDLWVEYKWLDKLPVKGDIPVRLSALQRLWLDQRAKEGRNVFIIIGSPQGHLWLTRASWDMSLSVSDFMQYKFTDMDIAALIMRYAS